jgi:ribosomal protein S18 acetylase RimI-like enzyme
VTAPPPPPATALEFDTAFFGVGVASAGRLTGSDEELARLEEWCRSHDIELAYAWCDDDATVATRLERQGFVHVDTLVRLEWPRTAPPAPSPLLGEVTIRRAVAADVEPLGAMASANHRQSRFYADPRLADERCDELYRQWIVGECEGDAVVLVADIGDVPAGYCSCLVDDAARRGTISLFGVAPDLRGRGVGARLLDAAGGVFFDARVRTVEVATQAGNEAALALYQRHGFVVVERRRRFHRWLR